MKPLALILTLPLLAGCAIHSPNETWPMWGDQIQHHPYIPLERRQVACVQQHGVFTADLNACMAYTPGACNFIVATGDRSHDRELTEICNRYRPGADT